jgi:hypothetical protein
MSSRRPGSSNGEGDGSAPLPASGTGTRPSRTPAKELGTRPSNPEKSIPDIINGAVVPAQTAAGKPWRPGPRDDEAPSNLWDLIDRFFARMDWSSAGQIAVILFALALSALLIFGGLGLAAHYVIGTSSWLAAASAVLAGGGTSGATYVHMRHKKKLQDPDPGGEDTQARRPQ